jgi:hypothetical protein
MKSNGTGRETLQLFYEVIGTRRVGIVVDCKGASMVRKGQSGRFTNSSTIGS